MDKRYLSFDEVMNSSLFNQIVTPPKKSKVSSFDPEVEKFMEIVDFIKENGREPEKTTDMSRIKERGLASRLIGIRKDIEKIERLKQYDDIGLFEYKLKKFDKPITSMADILKSGSTALLGVESSGTQNKLFDMSRFNSSSNSVENTPDYIAKRKRAEDFPRFEPLFRNVRRELSEGLRKLVPFGNYEIQQGSFYVLGGIMLYIESVGEYFETDQNKHNARLRVIFDNGTESDMLLRSLAASMYKKNGQMITDNIDDIMSGIMPEDVSTGFIYVLKSKSTDPQIASIPNLYKIGYTTNSVEKRIANAENESTYLYAPVELVTTFQVFNLDAQKFEKAIHHVLMAQNLDIEIVAPNGKMIVPNEWFVVPLEVLTDLIYEISAKVQIK
ncbi:hypothetical protein TU49_11000 [Bacillus cereus]|nr:hypothetical protein TU49_11000 [Bacillus cereus]